MDSNACPEFPYFGARYPDARCIDGYLWDLDKCNDDSTLYGGSDDPCPFCNTDEYIVYHTDYENGPTQEELEGHVKWLKEKYGYPTTLSVDEGGDNAV